MQIFGGVFFFRSQAKVENIASRYRQFGAFSPTKAIGVFFCARRPNTIVRDHILDSMVQNCEQMNTEGKKKTGMANCGAQEKSADRDRV